MATTVSKTIHESVVDTLGKSGPKVQEIVVNSLVETEIIERANLVKQALQKLKEHTGKRNNAKPDIAGTYSKDGAIVHPPSFSEKLHKTRGQHLQALESGDAALKLALEPADGTKPDYEPLKKFLAWKIDDKNSESEKKEPSPN